MSRFDAALAQLAGWPVPHAAAVVVAADRTVETAGEVEREFPLASVTKPLAALATLVAVEEEAVTLDGPLPSEVLAGLPPEPPGELTLRHLLAHASGLDPEGTRWQAAPATRRIYSNGGFDAVAATVAAATDMTFGAYFHEALVRPLDLHATRLDGSAAKDGVASAADIAVVISQFLVPGGLSQRELLHPTTLTAAVEVQWPGLRGVLPGFGGQPDNAWGLGLEVRDHKSPHWTGGGNSPGTFGHFGQSGTMTWIDPVAGVGVVALTDRAFGPWAAEVWPRFSDAVLQAAAA
ncbi:serine hydrolase domain-containing protein [Jatrophihabitans sp. YIM 134969]